jgi:hypothetical protein
MRQIALCRAATKNFLNSKIRIVFMSAQGKGQIRLNSFKEISVFA